MSHIFVSYSRQNQEIVKTLAQDIEALGHEVWFDQELTGGQTWWDEILARIREYDLFVFALSPEALDSHACKLEYAYAANLRKTILPVLVAEGVSMNLLPPALSIIQFVDYRRQDRQAAFSLIKALQNLPTPQPPPDPLPEPPEVPISYLSNLKDRIETAATLSFEEQTALVLKLKERLRETDDAGNARNLLERLRQRDDLFAKVAREIDAVLAGTPVASSGPTRDTAARTPLTTSLSAPESRPPAGGKPESSAVSAGAGTLRGVKIAGAVLFGFFGIGLLLESLTYGGLEGIILGIIFLVVAYNLGRSK